MTADVKSIEATLRFHPERQHAEAAGAVELLVEGAGDATGLDLRQTATLPPQVAGGCQRVDFSYPLATPDAAGAVPIQWRGDGVRFDFWMSDLEPGRYLEQWLPAPAVHDRFSLGLTVEVAGDRPHVAISNAASELAVAPNRFRLTWGPATTALSPLLVVAPADEVGWWRGGAAGLGIRVARFAEVPADEAACGADIAGWLEHLTTRYGPWAHPTDTFTAVLWEPGRGMEYDGATTSSVRALEHEVFHSWFGRGVRPAAAGDGWIDEAFTVWATGSSRFAVLSVAEAMEAAGPAPVRLDGGSFTPRESYTQGAVLFAGIAGLLGGAPQLRSAMGAWYREHRGGLVTTAGLRAALEGWGGVDLGPLWEPLVHGH